MTGRLGAHFRGNAVAYVALFIALGGTSYAAVKLPRNSVGNKQLKANAVTSGKIRNGSVRKADLASSSLLRGPRGEQGPSGPAGPAGSAGAAGTATGALPAGATVRGRFEAARGVGAGGAQSVVGDTVTDSISFGAQLSAAPPRTIVAAGATGPAQCPGTVADPQAAAGNLCIYVADLSRGNLETVGDGAAAGATTRQGTGIVVVCNTAGPGFGARGSWAVTGP